MSLFGIGWGRRGGGAGVATDPVTATAIGAKAGIWVGTLAGVVQAGRVITAGSVADIVVYDVRDRITNQTISGATVLAEIVTAGDALVGGVAWPLTLLPLPGISGAYRAALPSAAALAGEKNVKLRVHVAYRSVDYRFDTLLTVTSLGAVGGTSTGLVLPTSLDAIPNLIHDWDPSDLTVPGSLYDRVGGAHAVFGAGVAAPVIEASPPMLRFEGTDEAITPLVVIPAIASGITVIRNSQPNDGGVVYFFNTPNITSGQLGFRLGLISPIGETTSYLTILHGVVFTNLQQAAIPLNGVASIGWRRTATTLEIMLNGSRVVFLSPVATLDSPAQVTFGRAAGVESNYFTGAVGRTIESSALWADFEFRQFHELLRVIYPLLPVAT